MKNKYVTIKEAADYLRVNTRTVQNWIHDRKIKYYKPAKKILFKEIDLELFVERSKREKVGNIS